MPKPRPKRYAELVKKDYVTREEYDKFVSGAEAARAVVAADRAAVQNAQLATRLLRNPFADGRPHRQRAGAGRQPRQSERHHAARHHQPDHARLRRRSPSPSRSSATFARAASATCRCPPRRKQGGAPVQGGKLTFVDNAVDPTTGTITLKATFANARPRALAGRVRQRRDDAVESRERHRRPAPGRAKRAEGAVRLCRHGRQRRADASRHRRPAARNQAVIGRGVNPGDTVVTDGQIRLTPKSKVDVKKSL